VTSSGLCVLATGPEIAKLLSLVESKRSISDASAEPGKPSSVLFCSPCKVVAAGYFDAEKKGVHVCENHLGNSKKAITRTLTHELVHAYDDMFGVLNDKPPLDWSSCKSRACSEVRAAALSGDCDYTAEVARGNFSPFNYYNRCVKRRAQLSISMQKACADSAKCDVEEVFEQCLADRRPWTDN